MGKQPVRMKAVRYALSPFQQKVMRGLWKDLPSKIHHKISDKYLPFSGPSHWHLHVYPATRRTGQVFLRKRRKGEVG